MKNKKKTRKKNPVSPAKRIQSPLKNKLVGSPAKNVPATSGSPQKLIDGFLKQEGATAQVLTTWTALGKVVSVSLDWVHAHKCRCFSLLDYLLTLISVCICCSHICQPEHYPIVCLEQAEAVPSTSGSSGPSALQTEQQPGSFRPQAPNLAGAVEFNDVKTLLKEWITTISGGGWHTGEVLQCIARKTALSRLSVLYFSFTLPLLPIFHSMLEVSLPWQSWKKLILSASCYSVVLPAYCVLLNIMKIYMLSLQPVCQALLLCLDVTSVWVFLYFSNTLQPLRWRFLNGNSFSSMRMSF